MTGTSTKTLPLGFKWASTTAGIKDSGKPDVALAFCHGGAAAAAMFTLNKVVAVPVTVGRKHLTATGGQVTALLVNSGNANCATGLAGYEGCLKSCVEVAEHFRCVFDEVIPSSTGIIGVPFPTAKLVAAVPFAVAGLGDTVTHAEDFATAILTTDTRLKVAYDQVDVNGRHIRIFGCCKGAGMIGPQLGPPHATLLVYLFTDLNATTPQLNQALETCVDLSFNCISIDGDTSTNDTVLLLASGKSGVKTTPDVLTQFTAALQRVCHSLAHQVIDDGEGVGHVVTLEVTGARSHADATKVARAIAHSPLCKTAWSSADPNWGRLLAAAGYSGALVDANAATIHIGPLPVFERGMRSPAYDEAATHAHMQQRDYTIHLALGQGAGECRFITCDLTHDYVTINADYST